MTPACLQLIVYVKEKPTIREINYTGLNAVSQSLTYSGTTQKSQGRRHRRKPVRPHPRQARRSRPAGASQRARPPVRQHQVGNKDAAPRRRLADVQHQGRPHRQSRQNRFRRQQGRGDRELRASMRNLKPIGVPHSIILETSSPKPSTPASSTKTPSASARPTATRATSAPSPESRRPSSATPVASTPSPFRLSPESASTSSSP